MAQPEQGSATDNPHARGLPVNPHAQGMPFDLGQEVHNPHGRGNEVRAPDSHLAGDVDFVDLGGLRVETPAGWHFDHPSSSMRRAQFRVPGEGSDAGLVVYFFGDQGAGSAQANIDRWIGQFKNANGSPVASSNPVKRKIAGLEVTQIEVVGIYVGGMGSGAQEKVTRPGQRMIATIVATPSGPYYFKFLGADKTIVENRKALESLFQSMKASE